MGTLLFISMGKTLGFNFFFYYSRQHIVNLNENIKREKGRGKKKEKENLKVKG